METIAIDKKAFSELMRLKEDFDLVMESIELSNDQEFMSSLKASEEQVTKREFANWNGL